MEPPWEGGMKVYVNGPGHMTKMAAIPIYGNQRTNGPVNAHLISWPSKAQNIQNLEIYGKEMTLTFNIHTPS